MTQQKICKACLVEKDYSEFSPNPKMISGCINTCKSCTAKKARNNPIKRHRNIVYGRVMPRQMAREKTRKQKQIVKYGLDVSQAIDALNEDCEEIDRFIGVF